jgi:hypothetical protein
MTRNEFERVFKVDQIVLSGGLRSKLRIDRISDEWFSVVPVFGKLQQPQRMDFDQLSAVIDGFNDIDPKRIEPTIQPVLISHGLKKENTTENYLYGFARAYLAFAKDDLDKLPEEILEPALYSEGAKKTIVVNAYERSPAARKICLQAHGTSCRICKIDFGLIYGDIGRGFIHVHHLNPIAARGGAYVLDPIKDLCPVCPNCHSMLHHANPILTPEQLQAIIRSASSGNKKNSSAM